jgi:AraC family transcriptional regulator, regulatory protein of adaptative response / methylated-DNA-[protein]-cysteine methyltransferase
VDAYKSIEQVILYLDEHQTEQPDLTTLAGQLGLSPSRLHHLFSAWAAITPKDFLQCLTLAHARGLLGRGESVLGAALESGLSGPGRLHDLCVSLEAASPGELKSGGAGWTIAAGFAPSPFGQCLIATGPRGVCHLAFADGNEEEAMAGLRASWPGASFERNDSEAGRLAKMIFQRPGDNSQQPNLRSFVRGTAFQVKVWRALLRIRPGSMVSYGGLAAALGEPEAARAVGGAVGRNPLAYLIPCHRVIRATGAIGDYRWGHTRKLAMLAWESAHAFSHTGKMS